MEQFSVARFLVSVIEGLGRLLYRHWRFILRIDVVLKGFNLFLHLNLKIYQQDWNDNQDGERDKN
jgi:hypothetical protein